ncbi:MAG: hypothetical protein KDK33_03645 [Leptospiraceae bacterium]|nr:hypothetical protein [Leptospiraceae bacterium]
MRSTLALAFLLSVLNLQCMKEPVTAGIKTDAQEPHDYNEKARVIDFQPGVEPNYVYSGSCLFPAGYCVQAYSPKLLDGLTAIVIMAKSSCSLVEEDRGEAICQDRTFAGRCLLNPMKPGGAPEGTLVQLDIFYNLEPDAKEVASCREQGTYYPPAR